MTDRAGPPSLGVAMIGYSFMGRAHSQAWTTVGSVFPDAPPTRRQVLVGRNADAVATAARRHGWAESDTDWRRVIARPDIDIVDVCTPGATHAEIVQATLAAGKHVLVEKPLANTVAQAEAVVRAAEEARRPADGTLPVAMVGFNYRRVPALALARSLVARGRIGTVRQVRVSYLQDWLVDDQAPMSWRLRAAEAGTGALGDLGSHAVDQVHYLLGERVSGVSGSLRTFVPERPGPDGPEQVSVDDAAWATLHTPSGVVAGLEVSRMATGRKNALQIELYGTEGSIGFDLERLNELQVSRVDGDGGPAGSTRVLVTEPDHPYLGAWWPPGHVLGWEHTFVHQVADLLRAVATGAPAQPTLADGLAVQRVLEAVQRSDQEHGRRIDIEHED